jgi:phthiocerol/phenolphthiocerol synthesis type-I polyketide synthase E
VTASLPHPREPRGELETMLGAAGRLWANGVTIDWSGVHADEVLYRVSLPTYPFERKRHWVDAPVGAAAASGTSSLLPERHAALEDWFHRPTWSGAPLPRTRLATLSGAWLLFGRGDALSSAVRDALSASGATVISVAPGAAFTQHDGVSFTVRATASDDYDELLRALKRSGHAPRGVMHLWNVGRDDVSAAREDVLHSLMALGRALMLEAPTVPVRMVVATSGAVSVLSEPVTHPHRALANGPVLVFPAEHESMQASALDIEATSDAAALPVAVAALLDEARADDADQFVALRAGLRWALRYQAVALPATPATA